MKSARVKKPAKPKPPPTYRRIQDGEYLLALDVSSSACGAAIISAMGKTITSHGLWLIKPPSSWKDSKRRIDYIVDGVDQLIQFINNGVVMEWQSHLRAAGCRNANGLAVLGQAQGRVYQHLVEREQMVDLVSEREWTKINGWNQRKEQRAHGVSMVFPEYRAACKEDDSFDPGLDIADALGIGLWRLAQGGPTP
jgi:Holliday junction resolvasome RuvABC endonuclease subunit